MCPVYCGWSWRIFTIIFVSFLSRINGASIHSKIAHMTGWLEFAGITTDITEIADCTNTDSHYTLLPIYPANNFSSAMNWVTYPINKSIAMIWECLTLTPSLGVIPANIRINFTSPETRLLEGLRDAENWTVVSSFIWTPYRNVTDRQTDRQTDRRTDGIRMLYKPP